MTDTMSICGSPQIQEDLILDQSLSILSTLIADQDLNQGSPLDLSPCSLTQAKLGSSIVNIIVDDAATVVAPSPIAAAGRNSLTAAADGSVAVVSDAIAAPSGLMSDGSRVATDDGQVAGLDS
jgi:hypothetical protein